MEQARSTISKIVSIVSELLTCQYLIRFHVHIVATSEKTATRLSWESDESGEMSCFSQL